MKRFRRDLTPGDYLLIAANLLPIPGTIFWGWDPHEVFVVYCLETIIIGILNLVKMGIVTIVRKSDIWYNEGSATKQSGLFFMFFFLVHYGLFVGVQMAIFFGVSGIGKSKGINLSNFFFNWPKLVSFDSLIMLLGFGLGYGFKMIFDFVRSGEYKTVSLMGLMFQPYGRIFIQQFTVILGSMFLVFGGGKAFIIIFALAKIFFEVYVNFDRVIRKATIDMERGKKNAK